MNSTLKIEEIIEKTIFMFKDGRSDRELANAILHALLDDCAPSDGRYCIYEHELTKLKQTINTRISESQKQQQKFKSELDKLDADEISSYDPRYEFIENQLNELSSEEDILKSLLEVKS